MFFNQRAVDSCKFILYDWTLKQACVSEIGLSIMANRKKRSLAVKASILCSERSYSFIRVLNKYELTL